MAFFCLLNLENFCIYHNRTTTEVKILDNHSYFAGDNQTSQKQKFFILASSSKQDDVQYLTSCSSRRDFMLYLLPLQNNGEMLLFLWSVGIM